MFDGYLKVAERCPVCGLELGRHDSGDGPAVFVIFILGALVVALALVTDALFHPPLWLHAVLWSALTVAGALAMLPPFKAVLVALHFRHLAEDFAPRANDPPPGGDGGTP